MATRTKRTLMLLAAMMLAAATAVLWQGRANSDAKLVPTTPAAIELARTDLVVPERRELKRAIPITGSLQARNQTVVKAKVAGEIRELLVREGEAVRAGQVVARIDATETETRVAEKLADLEAARAQAQLADKNRENQEALLKQGFISQNAFDNALSNHLVAAARLRAADAQLALAKKAREDTVVRAPFGGVVAQRLAQPGERVPVDGKILSLVDLSELEVEGAIPAGDIPNLRIGQEVSLGVEGFEGRRFQGHIDRIAPATQGGSRSIMVYAVVENRDGSLRSGMFAKGAVTLAKREAWVVPISALREEPDGDYVYRVDNGVLQHAKVETGLRDDAQGVVEIVSGLDGAMPIVRPNLGKLRDGAAVRIAGSTK